MPKGLPDSVIYTAVKRGMKGGGSRVSYTKENADFFNAVVMLLLSPLFRLFRFAKKQKN